jgi:hypothetical protein
MARQTVMKIVFVAILIVFTISKLIGCDNTESETPTLKADSSPQTPYENPLGIEIHEFLRERGFLADGADVNESIVVWIHQQSPTVITGQFEGRGNGMFYRQIIRLEMARNGIVAWTTERVRVDNGTLYIDTDSGWQPADIGGGETVSDTGIR